MPNVTTCHLGVFSPRISISCCPCSSLIVLFLSVIFLASAADLPSRKFLNLAAIKTMVAAAESEAQKRDVQVTICIMDESGNLLFLQKADKAPLEYDSVRAEEGEICGDLRAAFGGGGEIR